MGNRINYSRIIEYLSIKARKQKIPLSGTLELTPRCNMNCKMCYIRMNENEMKKIGEELSSEEWIRIIKEAVEEGMIMLLLTGGEAILYKDFKKIYLEAQKLGVFVSINTNATMIDDEWLEFFSENPPAKFNITIYGGSNDTYLKLCGNPKGFDQLKRAVEGIQKLGIEIALNCTITKQNVQDMAKIYEFGKEHNLKVHTTTYNFPPVRKEGIDDLELNRLLPKEAAKAKVYMQWYALGKEGFYNKAVQVAKGNYQLENDEESCGEIIGEKVLCAAGRSNFWVTWDGRMLPCGMIPDFSVMIKNRKFCEAWKQIVDYTETITLSPECKKCKKKHICAPCAAKLKSETGSYQKKAEYLCEYTTEYIIFMKKAKEYLENNKIEK